MVARSVVTSPGLGIPEVAGVGWLPSVAPGWQVNASVPVRPQRTDFGLPSKPTRDLRRHNFDSVTAP